ncbi:hypothetical protein ACOMHN_059227 [Nucella lapillus]
MNLRCPLARPQGCTQLQQEYRPQMNLRCPLARAQGCTQLQQEYRPQMNLRCPLARPPKGAHSCSRSTGSYPAPDRERKTSSPTCSSAGRQHCGSTWNPRMDPTPDLLKTSSSASPGYPQPLDLCIPSPGGSCNHRTIFYHFG